MAMSAVTWTNIMKGTMPIREHCSLKERLLYGRMYWNDEARKRPTSPSKEGNLADEEMPR